MYSIGTTITANGAIKYFAKDIKNQISKAEISGVGKFNKISKTNFSNLNNTDESEEVKNIILGGTYTFWHGQLAKEFDLEGQVSEKEFNRLARGQHPHTKEPLIRHLKARKITGKNGKEYSTKTHRAGLDQTINASKSISMIAMKDKRVIIAHIEATMKAIDIVEKFASAKMGNIKPPEKTGKAVYAVFLHFESRPDIKTGHVAPSLHCHYFQINSTKTEGGKFRAMETREIYRCQKLGTAVYRAEIYKKMIGLGYEMRLDKKTGAPEVAGISREYIIANSPRQKEITETADELNIKSTKIVAGNYRQKKNPDRTEMLRKFEELEEKFNFQVSAAVEKAEQRSANIINKNEQVSPLPENVNNLSRTAKTKEAFDCAVNQARTNKDLEKSKQKFITAQSLMTETLNYAITEITIEDVETEFLKHYKSGELTEFNLDRRGKFNRQNQTSAAGEAAGTNQKIKENIKLLNQTNNERSNKSQPGHSDSEQGNSADSNIEQSINSPEHRSEPYRNVRYVVVKGKQRSYKFDTKNPTKNGFEENSDIDAKTLELEKSPRIESDASLAKAPNLGRKPPEIWSNRTNDQAARGRTKISGNISKDIPAAEQHKTGNTITNEERQFGTEKVKNSNLRTAKLSRQFEINADRSRDNESQNRKSVETVENKVSDIPDLGRRLQKTDSQPVEHPRYLNFRASDRDQRRTKKGDSTVSRSDSHASTSSGFDSSTTSRNKRIDDIKRESERKTIPENKINPEFLDRTDDSRINDNSLHLVEERRPERGISSGAAKNKNPDRSIDTGADRQFGDLPGFRPDNQESETDISASRPILQTTSREKGKINSTSLEANKREAERTAQIINVRFFSAQLDRAVIEKWTSLIEETDTAKYSSGILEAKSEERKSEIFKDIERQAEIIAQNLNLPKPEAQLNVDDKKLANALTKIEAANFEEISGDKISEKTFEVLAKQNELLATQPPSTEQSEEINENFKDLPVKPEFSSELETKTLNALLHPSAVEVDEEKIFETQKQVEINETAARETATLIQIAYGGQDDKFTNRFKDRLADEIYYSSKRSTEIYQEINRMNWQEAISNFSPIVNNLAEINKMEIKPPQTDEDRNKLLADFVTHHITDAYECPNKSAEKFIENEVYMNSIKMSGQNVFQSQTALISTLSNPDLESPHFSTALEARAFIMTKSDKDQKAKIAVAIIDQEVREREKIAALNKISKQDREEQGWAMSMS